MLEPAIKAVYERMAATEQPPSRVSIPAARRRGRARLRLRRAGAISTPLFAAGAVLAIALSGALPTGLFGTRHAPAADGTATAPAHFNPLRPYASYGWLPPGSLNPTTGLFGRTLQILYGRSLNPRLEIWAAGHCLVSGQMLKCAPGQGQPQQIPPDSRVGRRAGTVDGHPAYWSTQQVFSTAVPHVISGVSLKWQYARGGWAILNASGLRTALRIARTVRFGPRVGSPISFPFQLTGVPADWQVNSATTGWSHGVQYASTFAITAGPADGAPLPLDMNSNTTPQFGAGPPGSKRACAGFMNYPYHSRTINGYLVYVGSSSKHGWPESELCAPDANGDFVWIALGNHPTISAVSLFAHHVRLLGADPANWTTKPIG